jgi:beta-glucosidase-like glycosyl hydrolase/CubicO group peptidase (beta-lactamase class C family)
MKRLISLLGLCGLVGLHAACSKGIVPSKPSDTVALPPAVIALPVIDIVPDTVVEVLSGAPTLPVIADPEPIDLSFLNGGNPSVLGVGSSVSSAITKEQYWVDSVFATLTEDERVGQLLMLRAHSNKGIDYENEVANQISRVKAGGVCFFQGTLEQQAVVNNRYQALSRIPLMVSMDAEYGLGMRLSNAITYPRQMPLGAIRDEQLIYQYGLEMARQCRRLGVHISFSPVADINNNPANPVINDRSFGDDRSNVAAKAARYMFGLQDGNVMASAKHFPGHGDTDTDSHLSLPLIPYDMSRLDSLELYPFKTLIRAGVASFMVAHLNVPAIEKGLKPSTLSRSIITEQLREKMGFNGLIFTDAMEMKAISDPYPVGVADVEALKAGIDMVLLPVNPDAAFAAIKTALADSSYNRTQFTQSVKRVLQYKYRLGLTQPQSVEVNGIVEAINTPNAYLMKRNLFRNALTLVRDRDSIAGFADDLYLRIGKIEANAANEAATRGLRIASLALGETTPTVFQKMCTLYAPIDHFGTDTAINALQMQTLIDTLSKYDVVMVSHHKTRSKKVFNYGLSNSQIELVLKLNSIMPTTLTLFGNPYSAKYFDDVHTLMVAYTEDPMAQEAAAQAWFGAADITGRLPVDVSPNARYKQGKTRIYQEKRLAYDLPESVGMSSDTLAQIDVLAKELIDNGAAPGCQVLVVKDGKIVWNKAYGHYTFDRMIPTSTETIYDLASITKVAATTVATMKMVDQGKFDLSKPISTYIPTLKGTNKKDILFNELLVHQAGLQAWIAFYKNTIDANKIPVTKTYRMAKEAGFSIPVAKNLWMKDDYVDTIWQTIYDSPLRSDKTYKYSDLTMFLTAKALQNTIKMPLDQYVNQQFYQPMGLQTMTFNPWQKGLTQRCAPTEIDDYFRQQTIQGYVHDMGAAMMGGVSGHAGLFSNANDLAKLFQMLLNGGVYGSKRYISQKTVQLFTTRQMGSTRRGFGFDMKELDPKATANMSTLAGKNTFGHSGFTGNVVWADPDHNLIFIFLSNRTYPTMENNKLISGDYRPRLQSVVYKALKK